MRELSMYDQSFAAKQNNIYVNTGYDEDPSDYKETCQNYMKNNTKILKALLSNLIIKEEKLKREEVINKSGLNYAINDD